MQVLRTELYLETPAVNVPVSPLAKSISVAWFECEDGEERVDISALPQPGFEWLADEKLTGCAGILIECLLSGQRVVKPLIEKKP
jgi:hypothetical protein